MSGNAGADAGRRPSTAIQGAILGLLAAADAAVAAWAALGDLPKVAMRHGLSVDGAMAALVAGYMLLLAAVNLAALARMPRVTRTPAAAAAASRGRLLGAAELVTFVGLLSALVGFLMLSPGVAVWLAILSIVLVLAGGALVALGVAMLVTRWAASSVAPRGRPAGRRQPAQQTPDDGPGAGDERRRGR